MAMLNNQRVVQAKIFAWILSELQCQAHAESLAKIDLYTLPWSSMCAKVRIIDDWLNGIIDDSWWLMMILMMIANVAYGFETPRAFMVVTAESGVKPRNCPCMGMQELHPQSVEVDTLEKSGKNTTRSLNSSILYIFGASGDSWLLSTFAFDPAILPSDQVSLALWQTVDSAAPAESQIHQSPPSCGIPWNLISHKSLQWLCLEMGYRLSRDTPQLWLF